MSLVYERNRYGRKTEFTRKALIRYIVDHELKRGDRLPSQTELIRAIGTSSSTVIRAVNSLSDDGILDVRDKVGVFLRTDRLLGKVARTVALLTQCTVADVSPFYAGLALMLIQKLQQVGCQTLIFPWKRDLNQDPSRRNHKEFPGLNDALVDGKIDVVFDFTGWDGDEYFSRYGVPLLTLGVMPSSANSIVIDMAGFCGRALALLAANGVRNVRVVSPHEALSRQLRPILEEAAGKYGWERPDDLLLTVDRVSQGRELARQFFLADKGARPDGFVFMDEFIGIDFLNGLAVCQKGKADYHPQVAMAYDSDLQLSYPRDDIFFFEKKVHEIADLAADSILDISRNHRSGLTRYYSCSEIGRKDFFRQ